MKSNPLAAIAATSFAGCVLAFSPALGQATRIPAIPMGTLTAFPTVVQSGTNPKLNWAILYPSTMADIAQINPPGTITVTENVYLSVQPVCTSETNDCFTGQASNAPALPAINDWLFMPEPSLVQYFFAKPAARKFESPLPAQAPSDVAEPQWYLCSVPNATAPAPPVDIRLSLGGAPYTQLFYGTQSNVNPSKPLYIKKLMRGQRVDVGGRYLNYGDWSPFYTTRSTSLKVISLVNGATIPTLLPLHQQANFSSYLKPFVDASGKVRIGPMSVLILMELNATNRSDTCFDYQDVVLLLNFGLKHPNNGNGNNLDGVDSSNPGQGHGGPNGEVDPSGGFDDEIKVTPIPLQ